MKNRDETGEAGEERREILNCISDKECGVERDGS
jgi:hypothetical protein